MLKYVFLLFPSLAFASQDFEERPYPPGEWPLLSHIKVGDCLKSPNDKSSPFILKGKTTLKGQFWVNTAGGYQFVNPRVKKGIDSLTLYIEKAHPTNIFTGCACTKYIDFEVKAKVNQYKKLYVVIDDLVWHEINIPKQ
ncbi:MAG: hypothetical protein HWE27_16325 [Gammaproteobacteria bacterium]|nr:hypothetical protein [Gammaproteobacteria bacterium]